MENVEEKKEIIMHDLFRVAKSHKAKRSEKLQAARLFLQHCGGMNGNKKHKEDISKVFNELTKDEI